MENIALGNIIGIVILNAQTFSLGNVQAGERTSYFKKMPNGEKWFNAHRFCVCTAVILAFIGWFYILGNGGTEAYAHNRHPMYGKTLIESMQETGDIVILMYVCVDFS